MSSPVRPSEPALVTVSLKFGSSTVSSPSPTYAVYVDGKPVGSCPYGVISAIVLPEGRHFISVRIHPWSSDVVDLDLQGGDRVDLVCAMAPLIRNRFFKGVETKFFLLAVPLALTSLVYPDISKLIERHAKFEFLAVVFLFCLGVFLSLPKLFSGKFGAMLSLTEQAFRRDDDVPSDGSAWNVTIADLERLVCAGAHPFLAAISPPEIEAGAGPHDQNLDVTAANWPMPMPVMIVLAVVDTACVLSVTMRWFPPRPSLMTFVIAPVNGLLIGLLLAVQTGIVVWLRERSRARTSKADTWENPL